ncbi:hypothetical protein C8Q74DRAFT_1249216 [Fomes fomentarius]|nr:hypothetical protein C8Q74DRAFT_1249216 [Fomes fomentarius]
MVSFPPEVSLDVCSAITIVTNVFALLQYIPWAAFSGLRAFALSKRNILFAISIFLLSLAPIGAALTHLIYGRLSGTADPMLGCIIVDHLNPDLGHKLTVISRICLICADALLILVTCVAIPGSVRMAFRHPPKSFSFILLRDGDILLILNVLHLVFTLVSINAPFQAASYVIQFIHPCVPVFLMRSSSTLALRFYSLSTSVHADIRSDLHTHSITGILVSRFLCDLQVANRRAVSDSQSLSLYFSRPAISAPQHGSLIFGGSGGGGTESAFSDSTRAWSLGREIQVE